MKPRNPAGSWTPQSDRYAELPDALLELISRLQRTAARASSLPQNQLSYRDLIAVLQDLADRKSGSELFEAVSVACYEYGVSGTESYLTFLYSVLSRPLREFAESLLRRMGVREDRSALASDLVGTLFEQLTEALLEGEDALLSPRLPTPGCTTLWLFKAIRHDVMDHCKSSGNRIEKALQPIDGESYERTLDRVFYTYFRNVRDDSVCSVELRERQMAFLRAFEKATGALKERHQEVLRLRELENFSIEEMAQRLELKLQQVLDLLQYAREKRAVMISANMRLDSALATPLKFDEEFLALLKKVKLWLFADQLTRAGSIRESIGVVPSYTRHAASAFGSLGGTADAR